MNKSIHDMSDEEFLQHLHTNHNMKMHSPEDIIKLQVEREAYDSYLRREKSFRRYRPGDGMN
jgi:hypothetical protein